MTVAEHPMTDNAEARLGAVSLLPPRGTVAACAAAGRGLASAVETATAGLVLLGWIIVEALIIPFSWLQPTFFVLAIAVVKLAYLERLQIAGRSRRGARRGEG